MASEKMPRVSVVTAMYKHMPFLKRRIDSILNQTFQDWEWIIVDDCSPDGSFEYARELTAHDPRVTVLQNERNSHIASTNQRGMDLARGEFLYRTDSDDYCDYRFLERMADLMERNPKVALAHCRGLSLDADDGIWGGWPKRKGYVVDGWEEFRRQIVRYTIRSSTIMYRRHAVVEAGGFTKLPLLCNHDWYLSLRVCLLGDVAFLDEPLTGQRRHGGNVSSDMTRQTDVAQMETEVFGVIDDAIAHTPAARAPEARILRQAAYRAAASNLLNVVIWARENGFPEQAEEMVLMIHKYVSPTELGSHDAKLDPGQQLSGLGMSLVKRLTYKKLPPPILDGALGMDLTQVG